MNSGTLPILELDAQDPQKCGRIHGETLRQKIHEIAEIRLSFMLADTGFSSVDDVLEIARAHLPVLRRFDVALHDELVGIAEGANLSPERIIVLNHYTDLRDLRPGGNLGDGGCSMVYIPGYDGPILGQTWDIHGSAEDYVTLLRIKQNNSEVLTFTIAGCLGMTGMSTKGVAICINNLNSYDARIGVVWPALVRKVLRQDSAILGRDIIMDAHLGSGHHYTIADTNNMFGIETSGTKKKVTQTGTERIHFHTNHCLDNEMAQTHGIRQGSTTYERYQTLEQILQQNPPHSAQELFESFGAVSVPRNPNIPHQSATCGAMVMDIGHLQVLACKGAPSARFGHPPEILELQP